MNQCPSVAFCLALCALAAPAALSAQTLEDYDYEDLTFRGVGVDYGYIWPSTVEPTSAYGIRLDLGYLGPGVRIAPFLSYWTSTLRESELERLADRLSSLPALAERGVSIPSEELGPIDRSDFSVGVDGHFVWTTPIELLTYVGVGVGLHALNGQGEAIEETFVEDLLDSITPGVSALAGLEYEVVDRLRIYTEARYTLVSDVHYPGVRIGGALMFPSEPSALEAR